MFLAIIVLDDFVRRRSLEKEIAASVKVDVNSQNVIAMRAEYSIRLLPITEAEETHKLFDDIEFILKYT